MSEENKQNGWKNIVSAITREAEFFHAKEEKPVSIILADGRLIRFNKFRVVDWNGEIRLSLKDAEIIRTINCSQDTEENGFNYKCPKLSSDNWDEIEDPCDGCCHRTYKTIVEKV